VAIFLRESRTRHSLLTRQKTFRQPGTQGDSNTTVKTEQETADSTTLSANPTDAEVIIESDEEPEVVLHNIPQAAEGDNEEEENPSTRRRKRGAEAVQAENEEPEVDEKKLQFSTHYESFNICGWVLCLLITRKGDKARLATSAEPKQPLMEEFISTQAQTVLDED
jgi:hypothetical protein